MTIQLIKLIKMPGEEFVKKILAGERDLSKIKLPKGFNLRGYEGFNELQGYFGEEYKNGNLEKYPITLDYSDCEGLIANGLFLPFAHCNETNFTFANFGHAILSNDEVYRANVTKINLLETDIRGIKGLKYTTGLKSATFYKTKVTKREKKIIEELIPKNILKDKNAFEILYRI